MSSYISDFARTDTKIEGTILNATSLHDSIIFTFLVEEASSKKPFKVCYNNLFLRDASRSPTSVDAKTGQKLFTTGELAVKKIHTIPNTIKISNDSHAVKITWKDGDSYEYPIDFLYKYKGSTFATRSLRNQSSMFRPIIWNKHRFEDSMEHFETDYSKFMNDDRSLFDALINLQRYGITLITNLPESKTEDSSLLKKLCERVGPIRKTVYGETFDINNLEDDDTHISSTNIKLPFHMDLQYMQHVPGFKFIQSIKNETKGGENFFVDGFNIGRSIREQDTEAYEALQVVPVNYQYAKGDMRYYESRPVFEQNDTSEFNIEPANYEYLIRNVNYSPPFQAPFTYGIYNKIPKDNDSESTDTENCILTSESRLVERYTFSDFVRGLEMFETLTHEEKNQFMIKLPENSCIIMNNRRILHSRNNFEANNEGDTRLFRSCFLDSDHFKSKIKYLEGKFEN